MSDQPHPWVLFNDGEAIEPEDHNLMQQRMFAHLSELAQTGGMYLPSNMSPALGVGVSPYAPGSLGSSLMDDDRIYAPNLNAGPVFLNTDTAQVRGGPVVQQVNGSTPGTQPTGNPGYMARLLDGSLEYDIEANLPAAPGGGDPRWDTVGIRLGFEDGDSQSRDFQDAVTRANSTQSLDKQRRITAEFEVQQGAQQTAYTTAALSAGFVPLITKRRPVGESQPWDEEDWYYHAFPTRLAVERITGFDLGIESLTSGGAAGWETNRTNSALIAPIIQKTGGAVEAASVVAYPRVMNAHCRLLAVGFSANGTFYTDLTNVTVRGQVVGTSGGASSYNTYYTDTTVAGYAGGYNGFVMDNATQLPVWGNGTTRGPLIDLARPDFTPGYPGINGYGSNAGRLQMLFISLNGTFTVGAGITAVDLIYAY